MAWTTPLLPADACEAVLLESPPPPQATKSVALERQVTMLLAKVFLVDFFIRFLLELTMRKG